MKNRSLIPYLLLIGVVIIDAWMISHPNLMGRFGVWFYKYEYIRTFPKALITVGLSVMAAIGIVEASLKWLNTKNTRLVLLLFLVISLALLAGVSLKFSGGTYAHTGNGFRWGFHVLPMLLIAIFGWGLWRLKKDG